MQIQFKDQSKKERHDFTTRENFTNRGTLIENHVERYVSKNEIFDEFDSDALIIRRKQSSRHTTHVNSGSGELERILKYYYYAGYTAMIKPFDCSDFRTHILLIPCKK